MSDSFSEAVGQPCANPDCNFSGHAGFENYCSVCYKLQINKSTEGVQQQAQAKQQVEEQKDDSAASKMEVEETVVAKEEEKKVEVSTGDATEAKEPSNMDEEKDGAPAKKVQKNRKRCFDCKKKVGYTGFECRCGFVYCGSHRMPEDHACEFDHKALGRANLAKAAHKVEASKLNAL